MSDYFKGTNGYMVHKNNAKRYEHRDVWEKFWGRKIPLGHHIHHKNKDRTDNRIENLECIEAEKHLRMHGLTLKMVNHINKVRNLEKKRKANCAWCEQPFETTSRVKKFCCYAHARKWHNHQLAEQRTALRDEKRGRSKCPECGTEFQVKRFNQIFCCKPCRQRVNARLWQRKQHPEWNLKVP